MLVRGGVHRLQPAPRAVVAERDDAGGELVADPLELAEAEEPGTGECGGGAPGARRLAAREGVGGRPREVALEPGDLVAQVAPGGGFVARRGCGGRDGGDGGQDGLLSGRTVPRSPRRAPAIIGCVPRNDPSDTGGLFIGRRPGTAPVRHRTPPERGDPRRRRADALLAAAVLALEALLVLSVWGPQPVAWMWVGSQLDYLTGSVFLGIAVAFFGLVGTLILTLSVATRLDGVWKLLRRAAGHDQRDGALARIFVVTAIVAAAGFTAWFLLIEGPGSSLAPR